MILQNRQSVTSASVQAARRHHRDSRECPQGRGAISMRPAQRLRPITRSAAVLARAEFNNEEAVRRKPRPRRFRERAQHGQPVLAAEQRACQARSAMTSGWRSRRVAPRDIGRDSRRSDRRDRRSASSRSPRTSVNPTPHAVPRDVPCRDRERRLRSNRWRRRRAGGSSCASATAMQPLPVPTSTIRRPAVPARAVASACSTMSSVSGRGISTAGVTYEVEAPELAVTDDEGDRFRAARRDDQRLERWFEELRRGKVPASQQLRAVPAEHVAREHLGVERGLVRRDAGARRAPHAPGAMPLTRAERSLLLELFRLEECGRLIDQLAEVAVERLGRAGAS